MKLFCPCRRTGLIPLFALLFYLPTNLLLIGENAVCTAKKLELTQKVIFLGCLQDVVCKKAVWTPAPGTCRPVFARDNLLRELIHIPPCVASIQPLFITINLLQPKFLFKNYAFL